MKNDFHDRPSERRARKAYAVFVCLVAVLSLTVMPALAADDPLAVVDNLSEFIFSLIRAIGLILLGGALSRWGSRFSRMTLLSDPMDS